LRTHTG